MAQLGTINPTLLLAQLGTIKPTLLLAQLGTIKPTLLLAQLGTIKPTLLLAQLGTIQEREENVEQYFNFEFTHRPEFLFKKKLMGKPDKAP